MREQEKYDWMVHVSCMTFNQAPYIVDAMNGFTMQETNFPFVCAIIDDASTDGAQEVIKKYLDEHFDLKDKTIARHEETDDYVLIFARHKTNLNCYFAVLYLKFNHYCVKKSKVPYVSQWRDKAKYIAMCEGDDYWIESKKLMWQVEYLETHNEFGAVHTAFNRYFQDSQIVTTQHYNIYENQRKLEVDIITSKTDVQTCTLLYKYDCFKKMQIDRKNDFYIDGHYCGLDISIFSGLAAICGIGYIDKITAVYRVHNSSISSRGDASKRIDFARMVLRIRQHLAETHCLPLADKEYIQQKYNLEIIRSQLESQQYQSAYITNRESLKEFRLYLVILICWLMRISSASNISRILRLLRRKRNL